MQILCRFKMWKRTCAHHGNTGVRIEGVKNKTIKTIREENKQGEE